MTSDEIAKVLKRIGASKDGTVLLDLLRGEVLATSGPGIEDGALRHREGRRNFAAELIGRLSPDAGTSSGRTDASSTDTGRRPRGGSGAGRRVPAADPDAYPKR